VTPAWYCKYTFWGKYAYRAMRNGRNSSCAIQLPRVLFSTDTEKEKQSHLHTPYLSCTTKSRSTVADPPWSRQPTQGTSKAWPWQVRPVRARLLRPSAIRIWHYLLWRPGKSMLTLPTRRVCLEIAELSALVPSLWILSNGDVRAWSLKGRGSPLPSSTSPLACMIHPSSPSSTDSTSFLGSYFSISSSIAGVHQRKTHFYHQRMIGRTETLTSPPFPRRNLVPCPLRL
jgi:hypothetical protein